SHPPDELRSLLVGSHAEKVVRHATTPVLVVR
ncbi:MAG: universal stress protein, partial [Pseudomonadota bacterium]